MAAIVQRDGRVAVVARIERGCHLDESGLAVEHHELTRAICVEQ
jgi:hypothetical protein